ncbi:MAG: hypothetical protein ACNA71_06545 [Kiritimatiellia bacterium]
MNKLSSGMGLVVVTVLVAFLAAGCEKTITASSLDVTPASADITVRGAVSLQASIPVADRETRALYYPLEWSVSNGGIGSIREVAGDSAVYVAGNRSGVNTIVVRDQSGAEGVAVVTQASPTDI